MFLYYFVSFPKEYNRWVSGCWDLEVTVGSNLGGATCKRSVDPGSACVFFWQRGGIPEKIHTVP